MREGFVLQHAKFQPIYRAKGNPNVKVLVSLRSDLCFGSLFYFFSFTLRIVLFVFSF